MIPAQLLDISGILLALVALALALAALWGERKRRVQLQQEMQGLEKSLAELREELSTVNFGALGVGQRLKSVEKRLAERGEAQPPSQEGSAPYRRAMQMVEAGASAEVLVDHAALPVLRPTCSA